MQACFFLKFFCSIVVELAAKIEKRVEFGNFICFPVLGFRTVGLKWVFWFDLLFVMISLLVWLSQLS